MKDRIEHLFFDLDHTLWDFDRNAEETLRELYQSYRLADLGLNNCDSFIETYTRNNHQLWARYHLGEISKETLRSSRFKQTFMDLGVGPEQIPQRFEDDYVRICPTKTNLFPEAHETLEYLSEKYPLHLISNGFRESTEMKISLNGLGKYFQSVVISELVGCNKPDRRIFDHALGNAGASASSSVMIGDSIEADIIGALNYGMEAIYFNPDGKPVDLDLNYQIRHLNELTELL